MRINEDAICKVCKRVFCCGKCRQKHAIKAHAIIVKKPSIMNITNKKGEVSEANPDKQSEFIFVMCPICEEKPFAFHSEMFEEVIQHIAQKHLPLYCKKCFKVYHKVEDLKDFSKCLDPSVDCNFSKKSSSIASDQTCDSDSSKVTLTKASPSKRSTISTQTSPMQRNLNDTHLTPISIINLKWKAKSRIQEEAISDSASSLKNVSSINCSTRRSNGNEIIGKAKLIRSTSTPVQLGMTMLKPCEQVFNGSSGGHVSSIYSSSCESDTSPALPVNNSGTPRNNNLNRYRKIGGRPKLSAVTPLRQVMSKSIQKAFAEHGGLPSKTNYQPRMNIFDSSSTSSEISIQTAPLDLRSSPVIRRTQSAADESSMLSSNRKEIYQNSSKEKYFNKREHLISTHKKTTASVKIIHNQHLATIAASESHGSLESNDYNASKNHNSSKTSNGSQQTISSSANGSNVFKSCHSVEIFTSTEVSSIQEICQSFTEIDDKLDDLPEIHSKQVHNFVGRTPIGHEPGLGMKKNLIKFETPVRRYKSSVDNITNRDGFLREKNKSSPSDVFFTPNTTPLDKSPETSPDSEKRKIATRNLNRGFSPYISLSLRNCAQSTAFSRIADCSDNFDDEVFLPNRQSSKEDDCIENSKEKQNQSNGSNNTEENSSFSGSGRLWSLVSSVMRLPTKKNTFSINNEDVNKSDFMSKSLITRCASIAGSLVRSKSLVDNENIQTLKRKRTYTTDQPAIFSTHNSNEVTSPTNYSPKRFRIQGRKPIERMRKLN